MFWFPWGLFWGIFWVSGAPWGSLGDYFGVLFRSQRDLGGPFWFQNRCSTFWEGSMGPHWPHDENAKGVPGPSSAPTPHFLSSMGRLRDRSRRKPESSKYLWFYMHNLQWYIPWPLQGDPPGGQKKHDGGSWSPQGPTRRDDTPPKEPPGSSRTRNPSFF